MSASKTALLASRNCSYKKCDFLFGVCAFSGIGSPIALFLALWGWWNEDPLTTTFLAVGLLCPILCVVSYILGNKYDIKGRKIQRFLESIEE